MARLEEPRRVLKPGGVIGIQAKDMGGILLDAESDGPPKALPHIFRTEQRTERICMWGGTLARVLRKDGFNVETIAAGYESGRRCRREDRAFAGSHFSPPGYFGLKDPPDDSLFVALAWSETVRTRIDP